MRKFRKPFLVPIYLEVEVSDEEIKELRNGIIEDCKDDDIEYSEQDIDDAVEECLNEDILLDKFDEIKEQYERDNKVKLEDTDEWGIEEVDLITKKGSATTKYIIEKMYSYLKGYFTGAKFTESMKALNYAREKHKGQFREDSVIPYIIHPLQMACYAVSLGIKDDCIIATILLHDVVENCGVSYEELPVCDKVKEAVRYMTIEYVEGEDKQVVKARYFKNLIHNKQALVVKGFDRYMNLGTMAGIFEKNRIEKNVKETANMLLPVLKQGKDKYIELSSVLYILYENIRSINNALAAAYGIEI